MKRIKWVVVSACMITLLLLSACSTAAKPDPDAPKPSKPGDTGKALTLTGDAAKGETIFKNKCAECHGDQGKGGIANSGAEDGTVPALNPIEEAFKNEDTKVFAANLDLFIEHGSVPEGQAARIMMGYGDLKLLEPQEIADVIAYIISLNTP